jgi:glycosyltransferase involved in cell wall biosynthesis
MRILIVNQTFHPDEVAVSQYLTDLVTDIKAAGHEVTILAGKRDYENPAKQYPYASIYQDIKVFRVGSTGFSKKSRIGRLVNFITFNLNLFLALAFIRRNSFDSILGSTVPPMIAVIVSIWAKITGLPFLYWVMDLQPDEAIAAGYLKEKSIITKVIAWFGNIPLKSAKSIIVLDQYMKKRLIDKGVEKKKIHIGELWPLQLKENFTEESGITFREKHGFDNRFVIMYSGNHSICHPFATLFGAAYLLEKNPEFLFVFIGGGVRSAEVGKTMAKNTIQLPYQPRSMLSESLCSADVHVVIMGDEFVGLVHPSKIYGTMACGRPTVFIGPDQCHVADFIRRSDSGFVVNHGDSNGLAGVFQKLYKMSKEERMKMGANASTFIYSNYSRQAGTAKLISLLNN